MKKNLAKAVLFAAFGVLMCAACVLLSPAKAFAACSHKYEWKTTKEPTCTECGYEKLICAYCGNVRDGHEIAFYRHNYSSVITQQPTCSVEGVKTFTCSRCKDSYTESIAKTAHAYKWEVTVQPTCCTGGREEYICQNCQKKNGGHDIPFDESKHNWVLKKTVQPTCTAGGSKYYVCANAGCKKEKTEKYKEKLGHKMESVTVKKPTCCSGGLEQYKCTRSGCKYVQESTDIPSTGKHNWEETDRKEPTCVKDGKIVYTCTKGGGTKTKVLKKTGIHTPSKKPVITEATCTKTGKKEWFCTMCGVACQGETIPATKHSYEKVESLSKASTCQTKGYDYMKCTNEGCTSHKKKELPLADHNFKGQKHYVMQEATCTEEGYSYQFCKTAGCSATKKVDVVPALGHDLSSSLPNAISNGSSYDAAYHSLYCTRCKTSVKKPHSFRLVHISDDKSFYDKDVYVCIDENGQTCGCCKAACDCVFPESNITYYDVYRNLNDGTLQYLVRIEKECAVCHTKHSVTYVPSAGKASLTLTSDIIGIWKHWIDTELRKALVKITGIEVLSNGILLVKDSYKTYRAVSTYMQKHPEAGPSVLQNGDSGAIAQILKELTNIEAQEDFRDFVEYNYDNAPITVNGYPVTSENYNSWHKVK